MRLVESVQSFGSAGSGGRRRGGAVLMVKQRFPYFMAILIFHSQKALEKWEPFRYSDFSNSDISCNTVPHALFSKTPGSAHSDRGRGRLLGFGIGAGDLGRGWGFFGQGGGWGPGSWWGDCTMATTTTPSTYMTP